MSRLPGDNVAKNTVVINNHRFRIDLNEGDDGVIVYDLNEELENDNDSETEYNDDDCVQEKKMKHSP
jgi:hypothetical protein